MVSTWTAGTAAVTYPTCHSMTLLLHPSSSQQTMHTGWLCSTRACQLQTAVVCHSFQHLSAAQGTVQLLCSAALTHIRILHSCTTKQDSMTAQTTCLQEQPVGTLTNLSARRGRSCRPWSAWTSTPCGGWVGAAGLTAAGGWLLVPAGRPTWCCLAAGAAGDDANAAEAGA